ncbi:hypothetical protein ACFOWB_21205 [Chenggangzhangella methanolivorans]|uniref:hypothetical protein n=1 Tax=Chenggangzhangella methanolivorans TaxID=1437009 RepID=UPI003609608C
MRKFTIVAVAAAFGVAGAAETVQPAAAAETNAAPRSLEQVRENAMTAMYAGDLQQVRDRRAGRAWRGGGKWRGGRSWRGARYYGGRRYAGRRYYGPRRYYGGRRYRPGLVIGIRP